MSKPAQKFSLVPYAPPGTMTKAERSDLVRIIRGREKNSKSEAAERSAELKADVEKKLSARFHFDQKETWKKAMETAEAHVEQANRMIAEDVAKFGLPAEFAPGISVGWYMRGENAVKQRRDELRKLAYARIELLEKKRLTEIERTSIDAQTKVMMDGLSEEATKILDMLPTVETMMPALHLAEFDALKNREDD
jgi:hypothetical protein